MSRSYTLNAEQALSVGNSGSFLNETGKYKGTIIRAEAITSQKMSEGVEFTFKAEDGREAPYLTLWTHKADGSELFGLKVLNAMMTCLQVRELKPATITVEKWDGEKKSPKQVTGFPALMNKPIGLLLQRVEYQKNDGSIGNKMEIYAPFKADTEQTAAEVLDRAPASHLTKLVQSLRDKPLANTQQRQASAPAPSAAAPFVDDDLPF